MKDQNSNKEFKILLDKLLSDANELNESFGYNGEIKKVPLDSKQTKQKSKHSAWVKVAVLLKKLIEFISIILLM